MNMKALSDYEVGDVLELVRRFGLVDKTFKVEVTNVNYRDNGLITYFGDVSGSGAFKPEEIGFPTRYLYIVSVKKLAHNPVQAYRVPWAGLTHKETMRLYGVG
jgi:hypothetical protein